MKSIKRNRTMSEKKVLKKLGIPDFRHMTKDKVVKFASTLQYMDPEVAKKALEQFPEFKGLASEMVAQYKTIVEKAMEGNEIGPNTFYEECGSIIKSLQQELEMENVTEERRNSIEDKMILVAKMIGEKDTEDKQYRFKLVQCFAGGCTAFAILAAGLLGLSFISKNDDRDNDNSDKNSTV